MFYEKEETEADKVVENKYVRRKIRKEGLTKG